MMWRIREWLTLLSPRAWWYSWRRAAHVVRVTEAERDPWFYGSMNLEDELGYRLEHDPTLMDGAWPRLPTFLPAPPELAHDWREQTATALAPAALDVPHEDWEPGPYGLVRPEPGPGYAQTVPGPGMALDVASCPVCDGDRWRDLANGSRQCQDCGYVRWHADSGPGGSSLTPGPALFDLGPRAALVLERYEARRRERWAFA